MTWCKDIARDEAVRAAEDGRDAPLLTLGEAIASAFAEAAERSSTVNETGEWQSGLREQRVSLSLKHMGELISERDAAIRELESLREQLESVACRAATAETALESASGGSEPVAWMCEWTDYAELYLSQIYATRDANGTVVPQPLYRAPPLPPGPEEK